MTWRRDGGRGVVIPAIPAIPAIPISPVIRMNSVSPRPAEGIA